MGNVHCAYSCMHAVKHINNTWYRLVTPLNLYYYVLIPAFICAVVLVVAVVKKSSVAI